MNNELRERAEIDPELEDLRQKLAFARQRIVALEARANEDGLLGILNRRGMDAEITRAVAFCDRYSMLAALIYIDLNNFKHVNDTHGHDAGDAALRHVVRVIEDNIRTSDRVGRIGGDEFSVLLWNATREIAQSKAEGLIQALERRPLIYNGSSIKLSMSCGVTELRNGDNAPTALARADQAMYVVKKNVLRGKE